MPVYMEEATLLRTHLLALEWANKAAQVLPLHAITTSIPAPTDSEEVPQDSKTMDETTTTASGVGVADSTSMMVPVQRLPRLVEVQRLAKEIRRIRSTAITQQQQQQQTGAAGSKAADDWERVMSLELTEEGNDLNNSQDAVD